ncbi:hypothetical protein LSAT2_024261 [Lamellibrachia satsuma]|nr:hypothetical protein LSAT2_024261 [Lamellibrachia satsuma]
MAENRAIQEHAVRCILGEIPSERSRSSAVLVDCRLMRRQRLLRNTAWGLVCAHPDRDTDIISAAKGPKQWQGKEIGFGSNIFIGRRSPQCRLLACRLPEMSLTANVPRMVVAVVGVLLAVSVFGTSVKQCTEENVKECAKPMLEKTGNDTDSPIIPTRTEDEMRKRCSDYQDFEECLHPMKPNCTKVEQLVFEGIERYFDYFCDQKFDEYLKYRECFKNGTLHEEGKFCNTFKRRLMNLQINNVSHLHNRICQYVEDYLDCVENVVTSFCGKEAARWQRGLDVRSIEPILSEAQCPGWPTHAPNRSSDGDSTGTSISSFALLACSAMIVTLFSPTTPASIPQALAPPFTLA